MKTKPEIQKVVPDVDLADLAAKIKRLSEAAQQLTRSGLRMKLIVLMLHDATKIGKREIEDILNELPRLADRYTTR